MKELEDYNWFPAWLRNFQTDYIGFAVNLFNVYGVFLNYFKTLSNPLQPMTDLCSGSGEPAISFFRKSNSFNSLVLTDKFPICAQADDPRISYEIQSRDVLEIQFNPRTCYTMFNAFHHFKDEDKLKIVRKMQASGSKAFILEILEPRIICLLRVLFATTAGVFFFTPFVRPFSLKRLFFTYIIPINIFTITYDGVISVLKSKSVEQYKKLFANHTASISIIRLRSTLNPLIIIQINPDK